MLRYTHIGKSNLNLLMNFQALIEERSITAAARRLFISQSAMSRIFDRLQDMFEDELLVRTAKGYQPTHRAWHIYAELERLLPGVEELLRSDKFYPAKATDTFRIAASDYSVVVIFPKLITIIDRTAPGIHIEISPVDHETLRKLENNMLDLAFHTNQASPPLHSEPLFDEQFACVFRKGHPISNGSLTLESYLEQRHIVIALSGGKQGLVEQTLDRLNCQRKIQCRIPYFAAVGSLIEHSNLIATLPKRLAKRLCSKSKLCMGAAPAEFQSFTFNQIWHPRYDSDPTHRWLRGLVKRTSGTEARRDRHH